VKLFKRQDPQFGNQPITFSIQSTASPGSDLCEGEQVIMNKIMKFQKQGRKNFTIYSTDTDFIGYLLINADFFTKCSINNSCPNIFLVTQNFSKRKGSGWKKKGKQPTPTTTLPAVVKAPKENKMDVEDSFDEQLVLASTKSDLAFGKETYAIYAIYIPELIELIKMKLEGSSLKDPVKVFTFILFILLGNDYVPDDVHSLIQKHKTNEWNREFIDFFLFKQLASNNKENKTFLKFVEVENKEKYIDGIEIQIEFNLEVYFNYLKEYRKKINDTDKIIDYPNEIKIKLISRLLNAKFSAGYYMNQFRLKTGMDTLFTDPFEKDNSGKSIHGYGVDKKTNQFYYDNENIPKFESLMNDENLDKKICASWIWNKRKPRATKKKSETIVLTQNDVETEDEDEVVEKKEKKEKKKEKKEKPKKKTQKKEKKTRKTKKQKLE